MTGPNDVADDLIRRAYAEAPLPGFDVLAGLDDMHTRIREVGLLGPAEEGLDSHSGAGTLNMASSAPGQARATTATTASGGPQASMRRAGGGLKVGSRIAGSTREKFVADIKRKYERGASIRALAESTDRSYGFIHRVLSEAGVQLRGRGGATRTKKK